MEMKKYKLGELMDVTRGQSLSGEYYSKSGNLVRLTLGNFDYHNNCFKDDKSKDNLYFTGSVKKEFILKKDDIITPLTEQAIGLLGSTAKIPCSGKYIQSQDVALIKCNKKLNPDFAFYLIPSKIVRNQLSAAAQQTKIRHTSPDKIKDCSVWVPEYSEQEKIGKLLSRIDNKIAINRQINRNLEELAKQIYDYWFLQFDFPNEDGKPYKSSGGKMVWNDVLKRDIPAGWNCFEMQNICNISRGASPRPIEAYMDTTNTGIPWIKISDATEDIESPYLLKIKDCIIPEGKEKSVSVKPDTLIVSNSATPGIPKFVELNACVHDGWLILDKYDSYYKYYLFYVIKMVRYNLLYLASGSIFKNLKTDYLKTLPTLVPDIKILQRFDEKIERIMKHILKTEREINELIELRDNILPLLMNGQVTLNSCLSHD